MDVASVASHSRSWRFVQSLDTNLKNELLSRTGAWPRPRNAGISVVIFWYHLALGAS